MKRLLLLCLAVATAALVPVGVSHAQTAGTYTSAAIALGTNPATAGTTVDATGTFEILTVPGPSEKIELAVLLLGTDGNGTITAGSSDSGGTCTIGSVDRSYTCEFDPGDVTVGQTIVISTTVSVSASAVPAMYQVQAVGQFVTVASANIPDSFDQVDLAITNYTSSAIALGTNPTTPGTTVDATGTFEIFAIPTAPQTIELGVELLFTNGNGTITAGSSDSGGTCAIGSSNRSYICEFLPGDLTVGQTIVLSTTVSVSTAAVPATYGVEAFGVIADTNGQFPDSLDTADLMIEAVPPTTEPPTTEPPTTEPPTTEPPVTIPPTGTLPETGNDTTWLALIAGLFLLAGFSALSFTRLTAHRRNG